MAKGLRPHRHEYYNDHDITIYDKNKNRDEVITVMRCMICGHEDYGYSLKPHIDYERDKEDA